VLEGLAKSFALHVPVMPGFDGTSAHGAVKSMQGLAKLMGEFIDKVIGDTSDVMGARSGLRRAVACGRAPDRVDHLVLECLRCSVPRVRGGRCGGAEEAPFPAPGETAAGVEAAEQEVANRRMPPHYRAPDDPDSELLAKTASIDKLTLILHGTADRMIPKESVQLLKSACRAPISCMCGTPRTRSS